MWVGWGGVGWCRGCAVWVGGWVGAGGWQGHTHALHLNRVHVRSARGCVVEVGMGTGKAAVGGGIVVQQAVGGRICLTCLQPQPTNLPPAHTAPPAFRSCPARRPYQRGGIVTQHKSSKALAFKPLARALGEPGEFLLSDFSKVGCTVGWGCGGVGQGLGVEGSCS